jgi:purine-binding chemotaxis protein CheW
MFGLDLAQIERVIHAIDVTPLPGAPEIVLGVIDLHGELVPVFNARRRFGFAEREIGIHDQLILASSSHRKVALVVDGVQGIIQRPAETIVSSSRVISGLEQIEGLLQLDNGLVLIHDLNHFLSLEEQQTVELSLSNKINDAS